MQREGRKGQAKWTLLSDVVSFLSRIFILKKRFLCGFNSVNSACYMQSCHIYFIYLGVCCLPAQRTHYFFSAGGSK